MHSHERKKEVLACITAVDFKLSPLVYVQKQDFCDQIDDLHREFELLDIRVEPHTIEDSAYDVMEREGEDVKDFKLQRSIARRAIKYIVGYEDMKQLRRHTADRLNDPVH